MDEKDLPAHFGDWIKRRRKALDFTQEELASRAGCSVSSLRKIEIGNRKPSKQLASLLAAALDIPEADQPRFIRMARQERAAGQVAFPTPDQAAGMFVPSKTTSALRNLPLLLNPLIGREAELQSLQRMLINPACRLLTLVGSGGIGKTSLAIEVASRHLDLFPGGVCFVPLASVSSPAYLIPTISDALGLYLSSSRDQKEQLVSFLIDQTQQPFLLVLDNLEHLMAQAEGESLNQDMARLLNELLQRVTNLKLLVTSREHLYMQGEWTFELEGLPIPTAGQVDGIEDSSAVRLFIQRAAQVKPDLVQAPEEILAVAQICRVVEGSPLAIELAAAWARLLSCQEIAREIEANLDFLASSIRDVPERHHSLRATFDHSWRLLTEDERRLLRQLSVFQGGFQREAAEQVAHATLPLLASLVSKSLLYRKEDGRFDLHEVIRQYALSYLTDDPEKDSVRERHCEFYLSLVRDREAALRGSAQQGVIRELTSEIYNVRSAWNWAIQREKFVLLGQAMRCFGWFCDIRGWLSEALEQGESVVQALRAGPESGERRMVLGLALGMQAMLHFRQGHNDQARALFEESLGILRPIGNPALLPDKLIIFGVALLLIGETEQAKLLIDEGLASAEAAGDRWCTALGLLNLGILADISGRYLEAYDQMQAGLAIWRTLGDQRMIALALNFLSPTTIRLERYEKAQAFLEESLALTTQLGDRWGMGTAYRFLGQVALAQGNSSKAESLILKSLALFTELDARWDIARALITLGEARLSARRLTEAWQSFLQALRLAVVTQAVPLVFDALVGLAHLHAQGGELNQALELGVFTSSHPASTSEAKERARRLCRELQAQLAPHQIEAAQASALARSLNEVTAGILGERG